MISGSNASYSSSSSGYSPLSATTGIYLTNAQSPHVGSLLMNISAAGNAQLAANGLVVTGSTGMLPAGMLSSVSEVGSYSSMNISKPEAKKVKIQKSQPSKVVHIRNIPQQISEVEVIQFGLIFGNIVNVLNLRSKCQAFLEFEKCEEAQSMINYFANNPITVAGRQIFVQYSNYKSLVTDPNNTNNQIAKAALEMAKDLHKAAQTGGQNTVLRAMIQNMAFIVPLDTIYQIFSKYGPVLKIITFTKNDKFQALIQMKDGNAAQSAKNTLHGQNIYSGCCTLHIDYSKLNTLNVKYNNEKSRDYTNPLLPPGDCPDPLGLSVLNGQLQLAMPSYAAPQQFAASMPFHHLAQGNPFISFPSSLGHQTLITSAGMLRQTTANQLSALQTSINAAQQLGQCANPYSVATTNVNSNALNSLSNNSGVNATVVQQNNAATNNSNQLIIPIMQNLNEEGYFMMYPN